MIQYYHGLGIFLYNFLLDMVIKPQNIHQDGKKYKI